MNTAPLSLVSNIHGTLTQYGLDMLEAFMSEPAELEALTPAAPLITPGAYLDELAQMKPRAKLPEPADDNADDWDI